MTRTEEISETKRPAALSAIRISLWALAFLVAGAVFVSRFHGTDTALAAACGLLIGATANTFLTWKKRRESAVWAIMGMVALAWILALRFIVQT